MGTRSRCDRGRSTQHRSAPVVVGSRAWGRDLGAIEDARPNLRLTADVERLRDPTSIGTRGCWVSRMGRDLGAIEDARPNLRLTADVEPLRDPTSIGIRGCWVSRMGRDLGAIERRSTQRRVENQEIPMRKKLALPAAAL